VELDLLADGEEGEGRCGVELDAEEDVTWFGGGAARAGINYGSGREGGGERRSRYVR
jgi:hypothetical protein